MVRIIQDTLFIRDGQGGISNISEVRSADFANDFYRAINKLPPIISDTSLST